MAPRTALWLALALLATAAPLPAADFFVATTGSDTAGDGSAGNPWATITHALQNVPDGSRVRVQPGTYSGRVRMVGVFTAGVTVVSEVPYQARLRALETVLTFFDCKGITLEGFDVAHEGPGASGLVVQVQDLIGPAGGTDFTSRIVIRDNVLHDSFNNDILKINNGAGDIVVEGNVFYNQQGSDEHIDVNSVTDVVIQDNVFFNDFAGSGRSDLSDTSSFIVIKDSNAGADSNLGSERITVRRNVFLNWQGSTGHNFVLAGEDGNPYYEARDVTIENNLMLGNSASVMRAPFGVKGCQNVLFRHNTVSGDMPALAYAMRLNIEGANLPNEYIRLQGNIWSDPTGTMGAEDPTRNNDFSDTPPGETASFTLERNLYWNGGLPIPEDPAELVNYTDDPRAVVGDPLLPLQGAIPLPRWDPIADRFGDGSTSIRDAFVRLVNLWGFPDPGSAAIDAADPALAPGEDILGNPRPQGPAPDLGAVEVCARPGGVGNTLLGVRVGSDMHFHWSNVSFATGYTLYSDPVKGGTFPTVAGTAADGPAGLRLPMPPTPLLLQAVGSNLCGDGPR